MELQQTYTGGENNGENANSQNINPDVGFETKTSNYY